MRTFIVWLEHTLAKRQLIRSLLTSLGLNPKSNPEEIQLSDFTKDKLSGAISSLNITPEAKSKISRWLDENYGTDKNQGTQNLMAILDAVPPESMNDQNKSISEPFKIPPGQGDAPKPPNANQQQQPNAAADQQPMM